MARRSSARLRAKVSSTPQPQKVSNLGHDGACRTPRTAPKLTSLAEGEEMPGAFPQSTSPAGNTPTRLAKHIATAVTGGHTTPTHATPIRPSMEEMHPQKCHMTTAKPLDEARWLGFSSMAVPHTEPAKGSNKTAAAQGTPTKIQKAKAFFDRPPDYQFTFSRPSLGLSPEARQLMAEKKEEAARIKEQMVASQESKPTADDLLARKMATPKGKVGRFSDVHMSAFKKMDSIANHAAAQRLDTARSKPTADSKTPKKTSSQPGPSVTQSLKRTQSKADLDQSAVGVTHSLKRTQSKADLTQPASALPRATSKRDLNQPPTFDAPAKRVKRAAEDDATTTRPRSAGSDAPSTPREDKGLKFHSSNLHLTKGLSTPTAASLARASSIKSVKRTAIPALTRSPSKPGMTSASLQQPKPATQLLARSPSKMTLPGTVSAAVAAESRPEPESPLLSRSPVKQPAQPRPAVEDAETEEEDSSTRIPFLSRSPSKKTVVDYSEPGESKPSKTPLLSRSPSKIAPPDTNKTPVKSAGNNLLSRFNLLRASPVKSILRTPQRLYSDDPLKVARGTHFATPDRADPALDKPLPAPPKTAPVRKHVDFSASTKGNSAQEEKPSTPSRTSVPSPDEAMDTAEPAQPSFGYPTLPDDNKSAKKSHRRMTMALPSDFTFRAGGEITFAPSPNRAEGAANLKASIRHVSAEPDIRPASSKKRKLSGLEDADEPPARKQESSDKENNAESDRENGDRPTKKARANGPEPKIAQPSKTPKKIPTLGVKPRVSQSAQKPKDKRPGLLSRDRLNMLSMPKRR